VGKRAVLGIFAKQPIPGRVKTRMTPPLPASVAAQLYACLLEDSLETSRRAARELGLAFVIFFDPPEAKTWFDKRVGAGVELRPQRGAGLGARLANAAEDLADDGCAPILLRGSDSPLLGESTLCAARTALDTVDLVVCPDLGGGYSLIGFRRPEPALFELAMSTRSLLDETLRTAATHGLCTRVLPASFDLDTIDDVRRLAAHFAEGGSARDCPRTRGFLGGAEFQKWIERAS